MARRPAPWSPLVVLAAAFQTLNVTSAANAVSNAPSLIQRQVKYGIVQVEREERAASGAASPLHLTANTGVATAPRVAAVVAVHPPKFAFAARFLQRLAACPPATKALSVHLVFSDDVDFGLFQKGMARADPPVPAILWTPVVANLPEKVKSSQAQMLSAWKKWFGILHLMDLGSHAPLYGIMLDSELLLYNTTDCGPGSHWNTLIDRLRSAEASKAWPAAQVGTDVSYAWPGGQTSNGRLYDRELILENLQYVTGWTGERLDESCAGEGCQELRRQVEQVLYSWWTDLPYVNLKVAERMLTAVARRSSIQVPAGPDRWKSLGRELTFPRFEYIAYQQWCVLNEGYHFHDVTDQVGLAKWGSYLEDPRPGARVGELRPLWVSGETFTRAESGEIPPLSAEAPPLLIFHVDHAGERFRVEDWESKWTLEELRSGSFVQYLEIESASEHLLQEAKQTSLPMLLSMVGVITCAAACSALPCLPSSVSAYVVCMIYVAISVTIDLSIAIQKVHGSNDAYNFNPKCAVLLTEAIKLVISVCLIGARWLAESCKSTGLSLTLSDGKWLVLPAVLFTVNNILVYQAIGKNDIAAFGVFRDTMILWTAAIWRSAFNMELGYTRLAGIVVIFLGLTVNRAGRSQWTWTFLWVVLMTLTNALGSVANEFALKRNSGLDINLQNAVLYTACATFAFLLLALDDPSKLSGPTAFLQGFSRSTMITVCLQVFAGLIVSRILKYADSVTKTVASCLRGPAVVLAAPHVLGSHNSWSAISSAFVVATGCTIYLLCGPLAQPKLKEDKGLA